MKIELNVYDATGAIVKTSSARLIDIEFGTIRAIMKLLKVETIDDVSEMLETVYEAWDQLVVVLSQIFPDMDYDDWDHVKVRELVPAVIQILRFSFSEIMKVPHEKNV